MKAKEIAKNAGATVAGAGSAVGAVAAAGIPGLSGPAIMTGLATLGLGSAAIGIATAGGIGIGIAYGAKKLFNLLYD
jgi:hypothetical protein